MTQAQVVVFASDAGAITFGDKKGVLHSISAEGALFKGGTALAALKDAATDSAITKALNGRYRAASDILCAAFPSIGKAAEKLIGAPHANKSSFITLMNAVGRAEPSGAKGFSKRQTEARMMLNAIASGFVAQERAKAEAEETAPAGTVDA